MEVVMEDVKLVNLGIAFCAGMAETAPRAAVLAAA
jgi:hypothetical protein